MKAELVAGDPKNLARHLGGYADFLEAWKKVENVETAAALLRIGRSIGIDSDPDDSPDEKRQRDTFLRVYQRQTVSPYEEVAREAQEAVVVSFLESIKFEHFDYPEKITELDEWLLDFLTQEVHPDLLRRRYAGLVRSYLNCLYDWRRFWGDGLDADRLSLFSRRLLLAMLLWGMANVFQNASQYERPQVIEAASDFLDSRGISLKITTVPLVGWEPPRTLQSVYSDTKQNNQVVVLLHNLLMLSPQESEPSLPEAAEA